MPERVDDGSERPKKKKGDRLGFKCDRTEHYLARHGGKKNEERYSKKNLALQEAAKKTAKLKEVKFSDESRVEFLTTMHKKKNERRVNAMVEGRRKQKRENLKAKQTEREELRKQYNSYAKVPILPDYTYKLPAFDDTDDDEQDLDGLEDGEISSDDEDELVSAKQTRRNAKAFRLQAEAELQGMSLHAGAADDGSGEAYTQAVTVDVQPLFGAAPSNAGGGRATTAGRTAGGSQGPHKGYRGGMDFSDLPDDVADLLADMQKKNKGPAKTVAKIHMTKEMQKYHKIMKHTRKK